MPLHSCAPPRGTDRKTMSVWICPECGATWEAVTSSGVFDFDRDEAVTRAEWILVESPTVLAG